MYCLYTLNVLPLSSIQEFPMQATMPNDKHTLMSYQTLLLATSEGAAQFALCGVYQILCVSEREREFKYYLSLYLEQRTT